MNLIQLVQGCIVLQTQGFRQILPPIHTLLQWYERRKCAIGEGPKQLFKPRLRAVDILLRDKRYQSLEYLSFWFFRSGFSVL